MTHPQPWQSPDPGPAPSTIRAVFWLVVTQTVFGVVVGLPLAYLSKDAVLAAQPATPGVDVEAAWEAGFTIGIFIALGSVALWMLFAVKLKQGRNWARITMLVLAALSVVFTPINLANTGAVTGYTLVPALVSMVISLAILILLFAEPAKSWTPAKTAYLRSNPRY